MANPDHHDMGLRSDLHWIDPRLGGGETLASYGVTGAGERRLFDLHDAALSAVPLAHIDYIDTLPSLYLRGTCLFVHAGIRPGVDLHDQDENDLLWIRKGFLEDTRDHGVLVVHGHTPVDVVTHYGNRLNIDTGAGYGRPLAAVVIEGNAVWELTPQGRVAIAA